MAGSARPDVSVVVLSWNTRELLRECLEAVHAGRGGLDVEVVVVDNASADDSADMVAREMPWARLHRSGHNEGYAGGVNRGLALATGRKVCLLGSDTRVGAETLPKLAAFLDARPGVGAVAPRLVDPDGSTQRACMRMPRLGTLLWWDTPLQAWFPRGFELQRYQMLDWDHRGTREVEQPPGTCLMLPRHVVDAVGPMDTRLWLFFNDVDWAARVRRLGWSIWYLDETEVVHHLGGSTRHYGDFAAEWHRNRVRFYKKHFHGAGEWLSKLATAYVAIRQCFRIRKDLPLGPEYWKSVRVILRALRGILVS